MNSTNEEQEAVEEFGKHLKESRYILALIGAGLSASSGIPTFSGSGKTWRGYESRALATPEAFLKDPKVVWEYYRELRQTVMDAVPNAGHLALAQLSKSKFGFLAVTQNIDGILDS
jgi:NAD-dependent deacetylase sirtuin 5